MLWEGKKKNTQTLSFCIDRNEEYKSYQIFHDYVSTHIADKGNEAKFSLKNSIQHLQW